MKEIVSSRERLRERELTGCSFIRSVPSREETEQELYSAARRFASTSCFLREKSFLETSMAEILHVLARNSNGSFGISDCFGPGLSLLLELFPPSILRRLEREREREREREGDCCQRTEKIEGRESALTKASMIKSVIIVIWGRILRERERESRPVCVHVIEERNVVGLGRRERERERERLRCQRIEKKKG